MRGSHLVATASTDTAVVEAPRGKAETRSRLLQAAATVIARDGYERASLADMARSAGLTTGAVYSTFGSKWELMRAVIAQRIRPVALPLPSSQAEIDQGLTHLAYDLAQAVELSVGRQTAILQLEIHLLALRNPELLAELSTQATADHDHLQDQLDEWAASGAKLPLPAELLATLLIGAIQGLQLSHLLQPSKVSDSTYAAALNLLLARPGATSTKDGAATMA